MSGDEMIAYCGLACTECPAYIATKTDDLELRIKTAKGWSTKDMKIDADDIICDGCLALDKQQNVFCSECKVRECGLERDVENCSFCDEYACEVLDNLWKTINSQEAQEKLDFLRNSR
jgi:hypothetical protein